MKFDLKLIDRLSILGILPQAGNVTELKLINDLISLVGFDDEEFDQYEIKTETNETNGNINFSWNDAGAKESKVIQIGKQSFKIISDALEKLNSQKQLTQQHINIYELFCEDESDDNEGD